jgi:hypothetical protein
LFRGRDTPLTPRGLCFCLVTAFVIVLAGAARAASPRDVVDAVIEVIGCVSIKEDKDRLLCFDKAAASLKTAGISGPETATTKELVSNFSPGDYKIVDPDDIHVAPSKFIGKPIELRNVKCFYADKDDYRCLTPSRLITTVFGASVGPDVERERLESDCGAIKKIDSPACRRTIRIVPLDFAEDAPTVLAKRIVVKAATIQIQPAVRSKR